MAGEIKKVLFSEGTSVSTPADVPFDVSVSVTGILPKANGGTGITSTATFPSSGTVATIADITAALEGLQRKEPVKVATTANITLSGEQTIDGTLTSANRVLVKNQSLPEQNGIYVSAAGAWARASDMNTWAEVVLAHVFVEVGTALADTGWLCTSNNGGTLGTTAITWQQSSGTGAVNIDTGTTGTLPISRGGTGATLAFAAFDALSPGANKGDLITHDGSIGAALAVGANGKVLGADSAETTGLKWVDAAVLPIALASQVSGILPVANGGTNASTANAALANISGMTAKGDLITRDATSPAVLGIGINGQVLQADSTVTVGMKWADSSAGGSGEINVIDNPSAASATTGWTAGTSHTNTRDTSNSPLAGVTSTCFAMSSSAAVALGSQTSTTGIYDAITMPTGLRSKKLKLEFYMTTPAAADGTWAIAVYEGTTRLALSTDSSGDTILPSGVTGKFTTTFDTSSASAYTVLFIQRTRTNANTLYVTGIVSGPGIQPQGAVVGEWLTAETPAGGWIGTSGPTNVDITVKQQRVGSLINLRYFVVATGTSAAFGEFYVKLPLGLTLLSTGLTNSQGRLPVGEVQLIKGGVTSAVGRGFFNGTATTEMLLRYEIDTNLSLQSITNTTPFDWNTTTNPSIMQLSATAIPISEWAGSGTVNLAQNDVEYAYVDGWDTNTGNTTTLFGPNGGPISGTLTSARTKTITWPTATQANQSVWLEIKEAGAWQRAETRAPFVGTSSFNFGPRVRNLSATQTEVAFYQYQQQGSTFNSETGAANWSGLFTNWRLVRAVSGQAVGFGLATATQTGLVKGGQVPGTNTNDNATAGNVGEFLSANASSTTPAASGTNKTLTGATLTLTAGDWDVEGTLVYSPIGTTYSRISASISLTDNAVDNSSSCGVNVTSQSVAANQFLPTGSRRVVVANGATQVVYLVGAITFTVAGTHIFDAGSFIRARRMR